MSEVDTLYSRNEKRIEKSKIFMIPSLSAWTKAIDSKAIVFAVTQL